MSHLRDVSERLADSPSAQGVRRAARAGGPTSAFADAAESPRSETLRPGYFTESQIALIEGWAADAATHGNFAAWGVLSQCLLWRVGS